MNGPTTDLDDMLYTKKREKNSRNEFLGNQPLASSWNAKQGFEELKRI